MIRPNKWDEGKLETHYRLDMVLLACFSLVTRGLNSKNYIIFEHFNATFINALMYLNLFNPAPMITLLKR